MTIHAAQKHDSLIVIRLSNFGESVYDKVGSAIDRTECARYE